MKKNILPLICFSLLIFFVTSCEDESKDYKHPKVEWYKLLSYSTIGLYEHGTVELETNRTDYMYDEYGREIGIRSYNYDKLSWGQINYSYDGLINISERKVLRYAGSPTITQIRRVFLDYNFIKLQEEVITQPDNNTELSRTEFEYDDAGRETEVRAYENGELITHQTDYKYDDLECTFDIHKFNQNGESTLMKAKRIYYDHSYVKLLEEYKYDPEDTYNTKKQEYDYDSQGREVGKRFYNYIYLVLNCTNYKYDGKECIYDVCFNLPSNVSYYKEKRVYY